MPKADVYYVLNRHEPYSDLGSEYLECRHRNRLEPHLIKRLEALGNHVTLERIQPVAAA